MMKPKAPISMQVELLSGCNHKCLHCYNSWRAEENNSEKIDSDKLLKITDKIIDANVFHVVLSGGEPLLVPIDGLEKIIAKYKENNIGVGFNSNITLTKQTHIDMMKKYGVGILTSIISYDKDEFDRVTQVKGSFDKFVEKAKLITSNGIYLSANMVIDKTRVDDVYKTGKFVASLGMKGFCATRVVPSENGMIKDYKSITIDNSDIKSMLDQLMQVNKEFGLNVASLNALPYCCVSNPEEYKDIFTRSCVGGLTSAGISASGDIKVCPHFTESYGNVLEEPLMDIWARLPVWKAQYKSDSCNGCYEKTRCGGGCRENALKLTGDLLGEDNLKEGGYGKITKSVRQDSIRNIDGIIMEKDIKFREEEFGAILYKNPVRYAFVDGFTYQIVKNLNSRDYIDKKDVLEIGSELSFVNDVYVNRVFSNLCNIGLAKGVKNGNI